MKEFTVNRLLVGFAAAILAVALEPLITKALGLRAAA